MLHDNTGSSSLYTLVNYSYDYSIVNISLLYYDGMVFPYLSSV